MHKVRMRVHERGMADLLLLFLLVVIVLSSIVALTLVPSGNSSQAASPLLHTRRICGADGSCSTVGIPAGECATVHGVTVCVAPDAGISP